MYRNDYHCENTCTKSLASISHDMGSEGQTNKGEGRVTVGHSLFLYEMFLTWF